VKIFGVFRVKNHDFTPKNGSAPESRNSGNNSLTTAENNMIFKKNKHNIYHAHNQFFLL
jgi:hypothetical protein